MTKDWQSVKDGYEIEKLGFRELAEIHGCVESTVRRRARREGWKRELSAEEVSNEHRKILSILRERANEIILKSETAAGIEKLKEMKAEADLFSAIVKVERLVWWIEENEEEDEESDINKLIEEMERAELPSGAGEASR